MNYRMLGYLLGIILLIEAALLAIPLLVAIIYSEPLLPFIITCAVLVICATPLVIQKPKNTRIYAREGFVCAAAAWIFLSVFGALPFVLSGAIPNYINALFETVSGFTTTGASILTDIEVLPKGVLFWRSFTHWIGGMGVLVFMLAILPSKDGNTIHLMRAEVPGPTKGKLVPRLRKTAIILYAIYVALTIFEVIALLLTKMPLYDAMITTFGTAGTGGFSVKNMSIAGYNNPAAEWIIAIFLIMFATNFNMYFFILTKRFKEVLKNEELRVFLMIVIVSSAVIAINTAKTYSAVEPCLRTSFFQVASIVSTAGFSTANFDLWPSLSKTTLLLLTVIGGCAGSTGGGFKISRVIIVVKNFIREIKLLVKPKSVNVIRLDKEVLSEETVRSAGNFLAIYVILILGSCLFISVDGFDTETNLTAVLACINNVGPGFGAVGPMGNFFGFSYFSKIILVLNMLVGRLEIMPMLIFLSPATWRKR